MMEDFIKWIFTTSHDPCEKQVHKAMELATKYNGIYYERKNLKNYLKNIDSYFVVNKNLTVDCKWKDGRLFFHPSVSKIRLNNYLKNGNDYLIESVKPDANDVVLDLTLGLGSDALLLGYFCREIIGIEASFPIYLVVKESINAYQFDELWLKESSKKIKIYHENYKEFIKKQDDNCYDIVYCDPMFENPQLKSNSINPLRKFANYDKIDKIDLENMIRISKKRVVVKARIYDSIWDEIQFDLKIGSKKSGVIFGVIEKK